MKKALLLLAIWPALASAQEELENPGTVTAVQERTFRMSNELALGVGVLPLDAFYKGITGQVSYTYHFTDHFAWQVGRFAYSYNVNTPLRAQLERDFQVLPTAFEQVNWMAGSDLVWSPFYGKMAFLNRSVTHFEVFLLGGISVLNLKLATSAGTSSSPGSTFPFRPAANVGVGVRVFSTRFISFRFDVTDNVVVSEHIYQVPTLQLSAALNFGASE